MLLLAACYYGITERFLELLVFQGDIYLTLVLFTLLGLKCENVHHYSLVVLCVLHALWYLFQVQTLYFDLGWSTEDSLS